MAKCTRCGKFMLFGSSSGYCKECVLRVVIEDQVRKEEAERQRIAEEERRKAEEAERQRIAEEERKKAAEEAERQRIAEEERRKAAEEAKRQRIAEEKRRKEEAERQRVLEEKRKKEEAERQRVLEENRRKAEEERSKAEAEAHRRKAMELLLKAQEVERQYREEEARKKEANDNPTEYVRKYFNSSLGAMSELSALISAYIKGNSFAGINGLKGYMRSIVEKEGILSTSSQLDRVDFRRLVDPFLDVDEDDENYRTIKNWLAQEKKENGAEAGTEIVQSDSAANETNIDWSKAFLYNLTGGNIKITKYIGSYIDVKIPAALFNVSVVEIDGSAFEKCDTLKSITLPQSVRKMGNGVFGFCTALEKVCLPESLTCISTSCFYCCKSLKTINIPASVTKIAEWAFYGCSSLTTISIPDSVIEIGSCAFYKCDSLKAIYTNNPNLLEDEYRYLCKKPSDTVEQTPRISDSSPKPSKTMSSADKEIAERETEMGAQLFRSSYPGDWNRAFTHFLKAANIGLASAQTQVGYMYVNGVGTEKNYSEALRWTKMASDQGYAMAECNLATYYIEGIGVPKDMEKAIQLLKRSAEHGDDYAPILLKRFAAE